MLKTKELVPTVHEGKYAICMDFSGWFDQIEQDDVVKDYMCFPHHGKWYRLTRVAMGMRTSRYEIRQPSEPCRAPSRG